MEKINKNKIAFIISIADLQYEALEKIGRKLNEDEIEVAKKGLEWGLLTDINTVYNAIFDEISEV